MYLNFDLDMSLIFGVKPRMLDRTKHNMKFVFNRYHFLIFFFVDVFVGMCSKKDFRERELCFFV